MPLPMSILCCCLNPSSSSSSSSDCIDCDDLFDRNWVMGVCLEYTDMGTPLTGAEDAANRAYIDAVNAMFSSVAITWATQIGGIGGFPVTSTFRYASVVNYDLHLIYLPDISLATTHPRRVEATMLTFGAWWANGAECKPRWYWLLTYYISRTLIGLPTGAAQGFNLVARAPLFSGGPCAAEDVSPNTYPFSPHLRSIKGSGGTWSSETVDFYGNCINPIEDSTLMAELESRVKPDSMVITASPGPGTEDVIPLDVIGYLNLSNSTGIPPALPVCGI